MDKRNGETKGLDTPEFQFSFDDEEGYSTTAQISRKGFTEETSIKHRAFLATVVSGEDGRMIELGENEVFIGRGPDCKIQISVDNVSRKHASISFCNEEFHIEDLGSTNGTYINGVKIAKCILRDNDQIEIGGVKFLFYEEKKIEKDEI